MTQHDDQLALIPLADNDEVGTRHVDMLEEAIAAAREAHVLEKIDSALLSIARANARALDTAEAMGKKGGYLISSLTGPYREVLSELRMTPANRNEEATNGLSEAIAALSAPAIRNP